MPRRRTSSFSTALTRFRKRLNRRKGGRKPRLERVAALFGLGAVLICFAVVGFHPLKSGKPHRTGLRLADLRFGKPEPKARIAQTLRLPASPAKTNSAPAMQPILLGPKPAPIEVQPLPQLASLTPPSPNLGRGDAGRRFPLGGRAPGARPMIAIVIDDVGPAREAGERTMRLPASVTLAVLPYAPAAPDLAREARSQGHELLVHMPMQPVGRADPGPNALTAGLSREEFARRLEWNLTRFDGYVGINNHMGSRLTADAPAMRMVLEALKTRGLFYLDSRTTARTTVGPLARSLGVRELERDVFLDDDMSAGAVQRQLTKAEAQARLAGSAVAIGHPHPATLDVLERWLPSARAQGFDIVPLTVVLDYRLAGGARPSLRRTVLR